MTDLQAQRKRGLQIQKVFGINAPYIAELVRTVTASQSLDPHTDMVNDAGSPVYFPEVDSFLEKMMKRR